MGLDRVVSYILEGNINYTGVITWLIEDMKLIQSPKETEYYEKEQTLKILLILFQSLLVWEHLIGTIKQKPFLVELQE